MDFKIIHIWTLFCLISLLLAYYGFDFIYVCLCVCFLCFSFCAVSIHMCRGQRTILEVGSFLLACEFQGLNSSPWAYTAGIFLPAEPSCWLSNTSPND